jgi:mono/diheme cytochrome c family protein
LKTSLRTVGDSFAKCTLLSLLFVPVSRAQTPSFHDAPVSAKGERNPFEGQHPDSARTAYHRRCAQCHGENGEGSGNIPSLATGKAQSASDGELFWYITKGDVNNGMPEWASLPERQRWRSSTIFESLAA